MVRLLVVGLMLGLVGILLGGSPAWAISNPDSISISDVYVFRDVLESGDRLFYTRYDVDYSSSPSEDAEDTYQMAVCDTDGSILFTRALNYYQHNIISIYLDADSHTLTWESEYIVKIMGSPAIFDLEEDVNMDSRTLGSSDYHGADDLGGIMLAQADALETDWGLTLLSGGLLNSSGADTFVEAIPGLGTMAPEIFSTTTQDIDWDKISYNKSDGINETEDHLPVSLNSAIRGLDQIFGITNHNWGGFAWMSLMGMMIAGVMYGTTRRPDISMLGGYLGTLALAAYLGVSSPHIMYLVVAVGMLLLLLFVIAYLIPRFG